MAQRREALHRPVGEAVRARVGQGVGQGLSHVVERNSLPGGRSAREQDHVVPRPQGHNVAQQAWIWSEPLTDGAQAKQPCRRRSMLRLRHGVTVAAAVRPCLGRAHDRAPAGAGLYDTVGRQFVVRAHRGGTIHAEARR